MAETREVTCTVKGATVKEASNGDQYLEVEVQADGRQYPEKFSCWSDWERLLHLTHQPNTRHRLILGRGRAKRDKADDGQIGSYWWDLVGEADLDAAPLPTTKVGSNAKSVDDADYMRPDHPSKRRSIERQSALNLAIQWAPLICVKLGGSVPSVDTETMLALAAKFFDWIRQPEAVETPVFDASPQQQAKRAVRPPQHSGEALPQEPDDWPVPEVRE